MSATELVKQVAALPPQERTLFDHLLQAMQNGARTAEKATRKEWPEFGQRLHNIYGDKVAPDSQKTIDEARGER